MGCTCYSPPDYFVKSTYGRGAGDPNCIGGLLKHQNFLGINKLVTTHADGAGSRLGVVFMDFPGAKLIGKLIQNNF
jgi:hypothetical protein